MSQPSHEGIDGSTRLSSPRQPCAEVPRFASSWGDEAKAILMAFDVKAIQRVIRYRLFHDENLPRNILRNRNENTVERFLLELVRPQEAEFAAKISQNEQVEEIIRRSSCSLGGAPLPRWDWLPPWQDCDLDSQAIAAAIDAESHLQLSRIPFEDWVRYSLGYPVMSVKWFLQQHTKLYNLLYTHLSEFRNHFGTYVEVEKTVQSPFAHQALAQCLLKLFPRGDHDISHNSKPAFEFITSPIQRLFKDPMTLARILRVLSVLDIRFQRTYVHTSNMDWHRPFDIDISFINNLCDSASPVDLARTLTSYDLNAFANLSPRNIIDGDEVSQQYLARRHLLSLSVWECCSALSDWIVFIQECVQALLASRNYHSSMAILNGLQKCSITSSTLSRDGMAVPNPAFQRDLFYLIDPYQNYAAYQQQFNNQPGIPFLEAHMKQGEKEGPAVLHELFQKCSRRTNNSKSCNTNTTNASSLLQPPVSPRLIRKRSSFEAGIEAEQPAEELPSRLKKQFQGSAQSDMDTNNTLIMPQSHSSAQSDTDIDAHILSQKRGRQHRKKEWIRRDPIRCCFCNEETSESRMCLCGHEPCEYCYYYDKDPIFFVDCIPDANHDELWQKVREVIASSRCGEKWKSDSV